MCYDINNEDPTSKIEFQTASQSEIAFKIAKRSKYGNFNFVVEYPIWMSIHTTLTGMLALARQNLNYCIRLKENVNKTLKIAVLRFGWFLDVFF